MDWNTFAGWLIVGATVANILAAAANFIWDVRLERRKARLVEWIAAIEAALLEAETRLVVKNFADRLRVRD